MIPKRPYVVIAHKKQGTPCAVARAFSTRDEANGFRQHEECDANTERTSVSFVLDDEGTTIRL